MSTSNDVFRLTAASHFRRVNANFRTVEKEAATISFDLTFMEGSTVESWIIHLKVLLAQYVINPSLWYISYLVVMDPIERDQI